MSKQHALVELESFPDEEAATVVRGGDRPTPHFAIPRSLLELAEAPDSAETKVVPLSEIVGAEPADGHETEFWASSPRYSTTSVRPIAQLSLPPPHRPTRLRRALSKVLFTALFSGVLALLAYEASTAYGVRWSDVRGLLAKVS
jgi:hypothetical protein